MLLNLYSRNNMDNKPSEIWVFGYGSLIFKADFPFVERRPAAIRHWSRRFWQGSHDHRGTEDAPGRVVTLVPETQALCKGMAYLIAPEVLAHLDYREKNGYERIVTELLFDDGSRREGIIYIATEHNFAYLGPAPEPDIARHIARSEGPSGLNRDYLVQLADALRSLSVEDDHVFTVERYLYTLSDT